MNSSVQIGLPGRAAAMCGFDRVATTFDDADFVHCETRRRLLARLELVKLEPAFAADAALVLGS